MTDRRAAKRFELYLPIQVSFSQRKRAQFFSGHLRDISSHGMYFHIDSTIPLGTTLDLTFSLPVERSEGQQVLVRASGRAIRTEPMVGEDGAFFGVAAALDRIDFVRPGHSVAA
jgi:PilZ domain